MRAALGIGRWALVAFLLLGPGCGGNATTPAGSGGAGGAGGGSGAGGDEPAAATGGRSTTGGAAGRVTGGTTGPATGGSVAVGGNAGTGGVSITGAGGRSGTGGTAATGGRPTTGGRTATGGGSGSGTGGTTATGGGPTATRKDGACQPGVQYPAPTLTGTPKQLYKAAGGNGVCEGPVWLAGSGVLLFSDITFTTPINPSQLWQLTPPATVASLLQDAGTNGLATDGADNVYGCSHKVQGIVRLDPGSATFTTVVDNVGGKHFNSPNDLVLRSDGTIYFTDPDYQLGNRTSETGKKGVYRVSPTGTASLVDDTFTQPNGITLSPDETVLYVADYGKNAVRTFTVAADGSTSDRKDFATVSSPDGFAMDCAGNLYVASGSAGAIQVYAPSGTKLGSVTVASSLSNMAFGGADGKTLYITAGKALYSLDMNLPGYYD